MLIQEIQAAQTEMPQRDLDHLTFLMPRRVLDNSNFNEYVLVPSLICSKDFIPLKMEIAIYLTPSSTDSDIVDP